MNKEKGTATMLSFLIYVFIALAVLAIAVTATSETISEHQQNYNYEQMIKSIVGLDRDIQEVSQNKQNLSRVTIYNPGELDINCSGNKITGSIEYTLGFRDDQNTDIYGITAYYKLSRVYFEKNYGINDLIDLDCQSFSLNKGKNQITISYKDYNSITEKVDVNIYWTKDISYETENN